MPVVDGFDVRASVGLEEGEMDGLFVISDEGFIDGSRRGTLEGCRDGRMLINFVLRNEGCLVDFLLKGLVGRCDVFLDSVREGRLFGFLDGLLEGRLLCFLDWRLVGFLIVGLEVRRVVGFLLGRRRIH